MITEFVCWFGSSCALRHIWAFVYLTAAGGDRGSADEGVGADIGRVGGDGGVGVGGS